MVLKVSYKWGYHSINGIKLITGKGHDCDLGVHVINQCDYDINNHQLLGLTDFHVKRTKFAGPG
jgi:hypothetical protein